MNNRSDQKQIEKLMELLSVCDISVKEIREIIKEHNSAFTKYGNFASPHEGYAFIKEELDELWGEIKKKPIIARSRHEMRSEAIQVAAAALRFVIDCENFDLP